VTSSYTGQRRVTLELRPSRVCYLVRTGNPKDLRIAVSEATTRWGGQTEPIVEATPAGRLTEADVQIAEILGLDAAVNIGLKTDAARLAAARLGLPLVALADIDRLGSESATCHPLGVGDPDNKTSSVLSRSLEHWEIVAAGHLSEMSIADWNKVAPIQRVRTSDEIGRAQIHQTSALAVGMRRFSWHRAEGHTPGPATICFAGSSVRESVRFWNLRALSVPGLDAPMIILPTDISSWVGFADQLRSVLNVHRTTPTVVLTSSSLDAGELHNRAKLLGFSEELSDRLSGNLFGAPPDDLTATPTYWINKDPRLWLCHGRRYGAPTHELAHVFAGQPTTVDFRAPIPLRQGIVRARLSGFTDPSIPERAGVAELFVRNARFNDSSLEIRTQAAPTYRITVDSPSKQQILMSAVGNSFILSDKGKYAEAIRLLIDPRELLRPGVAESIRALTTPRSKELQRQLDRAVEAGSQRSDLLEIASSWGGRVAQRSRSAVEVAQETQLRSDDVARVLERLATYRLAKRGLQIECSRCGIQSFVLVAEAGGRAACPGCESEQGFVVEGSSVKVVYRLNSLVDVASDNGVIGHLLAVGAILNSDPDAYIVPGVNVTINDSAAELDLLGYSAGRVIAGEVKLSAKEFTRIERDIEISKSMNADVHLMACVDDLPEEVARMAQQLANDADIDLLTLDRRQTRTNE
jgi:hypothetical protein